MERLYALFDALPSVPYWGIGIALVVLAIFLALGGYRLFGIVYVPDDKIGLVSKKFVLIGAHKALPDGRIVALEGEAGFQADTLAPGLYFWYWPWQYAITIEKFTVVPKGMIGIVESKDGIPIPMGRVLGMHVDSDRFQDARKFLSGGGQRGPQMDVIPPGSYRINTTLFTVAFEKALVVPQDKVAVVTTLEGVSLPPGEIAGKIVEGHDLFQNAHAFVTKGGFKGLQEQVMMAGVYFVNPRFVEVQFIDLTPVPIGHVGVVVSYVGAEGQDVTGAAFTHGNIVGKGQKGVWAAPLDPGRYPINTFTHKVEIVPTTNIVLNWADAKSEAHKLDANLSTIKLRSKDGFGFALDVAQIVHVPREQAPKVIARFGSMSNLVTQVLEPTIGNYFRNSAQASEVLDFLSGRVTRQQEAAQFIKAALDNYNVQAVDTLIGDIVPPEPLMATLTDRKVAAEREKTFKTQEAAEKQRQEFERAKAEADTRQRVVTAARDVEVATQEALAIAQKAEGEANARKKIAEGEAFYTETTGAADAKKVTAVGDAEAAVLEKKVNAVGASSYTQMNIFDRLATAKIPLVPQIFAGGSADGSSGGVVNALLGVLLGKQMEADKTDKKLPPPSV